MTGCGCGIKGVWLTCLLGEKGRRRFATTAVPASKHSCFSLRNICNTAFQQSWSNTHVRNSLVERDRLSRHLDNTINTETLDLYHLTFDPISYLEAAILSGKFSECRALAKVGINWGCVEMRQRISSLLEAKLPSNRKMAAQSPSNC